MTTFVIIFYSIFGAFLLWALYEGVKTRRTEDERFRQANLFWLHITPSEIEDNSEEIEEPEINSENLENQNLAISALVKLGIRKRQAEELIKNVVDNFGPDLKVEELIKKSLKC